MANEMGPEVTGVPRRQVLKRQCVVYNVAFLASAVVGADHGVGFSLHLWVTARGRAPLLTTFPRVYNERKRLVVVSY